MKNDRFCNKVRRNFLRFTRIIEKKANNLTEERKETVRKFGKERKRYKFNNIS